MRTPDLVVSERAELLRLSADVEALRLRAERLREALGRAIEAIDRAEPNKHSPWCNGVHEGGCCEGEPLMVGFMEYLRAAPETEP